MWMFMLSRFGGGCGSSRLRLVLVLVLVLALCLRCSSVQLSMYSLDEDWVTSIHNVGWFLVEQDPETPDQREEFRRPLYQRAAELAMGIATIQQALKWQTLGELPSAFYRRLKENSPAHIHALWNIEPRLDGHPVLAVTQPAFWRVDGWNRAGPDHVLYKGRVLVEDPIGLLRRCPVNGRRGEAQKKRNSARGPRKQTTTKPTERKHQRRVKPSRGLRRKPSQGSEIGSCFIVYCIPVLYFNRMLSS